MQSLVKLMETIAQHPDAPPVMRCRAYFLADQFREAANLKAFTDLFGSYGSGLYHGLRRVQ